MLFTDGLVEDSDRDIGTGLGLLRHNLSEVRGATPEETCRAVFDAMVTSRARDDIALVAARTNRLAGDQAAEWDVPFDPAVVSVVRAQCGRRLQDWGLEDIGFATELILSELITNAIRYGAPPVRVRLVHDRSLICEVFDGSSTSPHLRLEAATDQGERGGSSWSPSSPSAGAPATPTGARSSGPSSPCRAARPRTPEGTWSRFF